MIRQGTPLPCLYVLIKDRGKSGPSVVSGLFFCPLRRSSNNSDRCMPDRIIRYRIAAAVEKAGLKFSGCKGRGGALTLAPMNISHIRINGWWWAR